MHERMNECMNKAMHVWLILAQCLNNRSRQLWSITCMLHVLYLSFSSIAECWKLLQVVMTANAFVWSYIAMPHTPQEHAVAMRVSSPVNSSCIQVCLWLVSMLTRLKALQNHSYLPMHMCQTTSVQDDVIASHLFCLVGQFTLLQAWCIRLTPRGSSSVQLACYS